MRARRLAGFAIAGFLASMGCERKTGVVEVAPTAPVADPVARTKTLETSRLGAALDAYERKPNAENHASVKLALADLDGEIAELEALVAKRTGGERDEAAVKLKNLQAYRSAAMARLTAAKAGTPLAIPVPVNGRTGAEKVEDTAKGVGNSIEDAARKTGDAIKDAVR